LLINFLSDTVRALCEALSSYEGTVIAVSHDETFVNKVINNVPGVSSSSAKKTSQGKIWVLSKCRLRRFDGTFKEYKKLIMSKVEKTISGN
jgi:ATPase subunit of ABC transporter with duplicated ATPase domains